MPIIETPAILIGEDGLQSRISILDISEKGFIQARSYDELKLQTKYQLAIPQMSIRTKLTVTSLETDGDGYRFEAITEEPARNIQEKIILGRMMKK